MRLERNKFVRWLRTKPLSEIVGVQRDCLSCPIGNFYSDVAGNNIVISSDPNLGGYVADRGGGYQRLPAWAEEFAFAVDGEPDGKITAGRALEILGAESASVQTKGET